MSHFLYWGKRIFYQEYGQGAPMIFLHGNTASSKMFELLMPLYAESFRCILMDFLGNGRSDRVEEFPPDVWYDEALQAISLAEHLRCGRAFLVGTSGGAWAAVNGALERPDLFRAVIADSFDGRALHEDFAHCLKVERAAAKAAPRPGNSMSGVRERIGSGWLIWILKLCCSARRKIARCFTGP